MTETYFYIISCLALTSFISVPCCSDAGAAAASPLLLYLQYVPGLVVFTHLPPHALSLLDLTRSGPHQVPNKCFKPQLIWRWNLKASHTLSSQPYASITHFTRLHLTALLQVILDHWKPLPHVCLPSQWIAKHQPTQHRTQETLDTSQGCIFCTGIESISAGLYLIDSFSNPDSFCW